MPLHYAAVLIIIHSILLAAHITVYLTLLMYVKSLQEELGACAAKSKKGMSMARIALKVVLKILPLLCTWLLIFTMAVVSVDEVVITTVVDSTVGIIVLPLISLMDLFITIFCTKNMLSHIKVPQKRIVKWFKLRLIT